MNHSKYILSFVELLSFKKELNSFKIISESCRVSVDDALSSSQQEMAVASLLIQSKKLEAKMLFFQN